MTESGSFNLEVSPTTSIVNVQLRGYVDQDLVGKVCVALETPLSQRKNRVIIDLSQCSLINSPGVAGLIDLIMAVQEDHFGKVAFSGLSALINEVFAFAGLDSYAMICTSHQEAVEKIGQG